MRVGDPAGSAAYAGGVVFTKLLRAGEGKILRRLSKIADAVEGVGRAERLVDDRAEGQRGDVDVRAPVDALPGTEGSRLRGVRVGCVTARTSARACLDVLISGLTGQVIDA